MINLYSGTPGSGKSLMAAYEIINRLNLRRDVIANFPIDLSYFGKRKIGRFTWLDNSELTVSYLLDYAKNIINRNGNIKLLFLLMNVLLCLIAEISTVKIEWNGLFSSSNIASSASM